MESIHSTFTQAISFINAYISFLVILFFKNEKVCFETVQSEEGIRINGDMPTYLGELK